MSSDNYVPTDQELKDAKAKAVKAWLRANCNVVGIGIGKKVKDGETTETPCIRVYVVAKFDQQDAPLRKEDLSEDEAIPVQVPDSQVETDVIQVARFGRNLFAPKTREDQAIEPGSAIRVQTTAPNVDSGFLGTLGGFVTDDNGNSYILRCNHVLAVNGRVFKDPRTKPVVVSAGLAGTQPTIAEPSPNGYIELKRDAPNFADCAVARLVGAAGKPSGFQKSIEPENVEGLVHKTGAVTGYRVGKIVDTAVDLYIDYSFGTFLFENQILIDGGQELDGTNDAEKAFAAAGDSGSLVFDSNEQATAMIFAASGRYAVACPVDPVLAALGQELNKGKPLSMVAVPAIAERKTESSCVV